MTCALLGAAQAQPSLSGPAGGQTAAVEGTLEILIEDHPDRAKTRHFLKTEQGRVELRFRGKPVHLQTGAIVRARGRLSANTLELNEDDPATLTVVATAPAAIASGEQRLAVLLVNFVNDTSQPFSLAQTRDLVFNQLNAFIRENSFNQAWISGDVHGWLTLPIAATCATSDIAAAAKQAAAAAGVNLAAYTRFIYMFPRNAACGWSGVGTVGGASSDAWINGRFELKVVAHELGHNFGLYHAHALDCDLTPLTQNCTTYDYGDVSDVMGNTNATHFNTFHKERLGWLTSGASASIATVTTSGTYTIGGYQTGSAGTKALKVLKGVDGVSATKTWYYVEYRRPVGFDAVLSTQYASNLVDGVQIRVGTDNDANSSYLLDMTPNTVPTFDLGDAALVSGQVFSDSTTGIAVTMLAHDGNQATVNVTFNPASQCVRANPEVTFSPSSAAGTAGATASYDITLSNFDGVACSPSSFNLQAILPSGWSSAFASGALVLGPGASTTTRLTVTSAAAATAGSYPINVLAANGSAATYAGLASGTYTVQASSTSLAATVSPDKSIYALNETVRATAVVTAAGAPVANAAVTFTFVKPNGMVVTQQGKTNNSGVATANYRISRKDLRGAWQLRADAVSAPASTNASSGFSVQ